MGHASPAKRNSHYPLRITHYEEKLYRKGINNKSNPKAQSAKKRAKGGIRDTLLVILMPSALILVGLAMAGCHTLDCFV